MLSTGSKRTVKYMPIFLVMALPSIGHWKVGEDPIGFAGAIAVDADGKSFVTCSSSQESFLLSVQRRDSKKVSRLLSLSRTFI